MSNKIIFLSLILQINCLFSQMVSFGVSFTPYDVEVSTVYKVEFAEDEIALKKILDYFYPKRSEKNDESVTSAEEDKFVSTTTKTTDDYFIIDGTSSIKLQDVKKMFAGFGRSEIIRLLLIKQKSADNPPLRDLLKDYNKLRNWSKLAQKYKLEYVTDVWLPSREIYTILFEVGKDEEKH